MSYLELINSFWQDFKVKGMSSMDATMYLLLVQECNIRNWLNPFELQTRYLEVTLQISRKTIGEVRNRLKQYGLIDFSEGKGSGPAVYEIKGASLTNEALSDKICVSDCVSPTKHKVDSETICVSPTKHKGNTNGNTKVTQRLHKPEKHLIIQRLKTKDNKTVSRAADAAPSRSQTEEQILFGKKEIDSLEPKGQKSQKSPTPQPPSLAEVTAYFEAKGQRLMDWRIEAQKFYYHYDGLGWRNSNGAKIAHWDSMANKWIINQQEKERNEQVSKTGQRAGPSAGVPIRGRVVPAYGLQRRDDK